MDTKENAFKNIVSANPNMEPTEEWIRFVNCFYNDRPRLQNLLLQAKVSVESDLIRVTVCPLNDAQRKWLLNGPIKELEDCYVSHASRDFRHIVELGPSSSFQ